jgi:hypothetical protein
VVRLEAGRPWPDWLAAGPFRVEGEADPLASIGGLAAARPESGTAVPYTPAGEPAATGRCVFAPIDPKYVIDRAFAERIRKPEWEGAIELKTATGEARLSPSCFYTVLENAAPGLYRIEWPFQKVRMARVFLAGRELARGDVVRLDAGRFPLMALAAPMVTGGFMGVEFYVRFAAVGEAEARDWLERQARHYQADLEDWRDGRQAWEQSGRPHPRAPYWLGVARTRIDNYILTLGEHGWNTEGEAYHQHTCRLVLPFAHAYRHTRGKDLALAPNLGRMFPLYVARTIVGPSSARMQAYGPGGGPLGLDNWARGFALVPDPYRRPALWTWNRTQALADAGRFKLPEAPVDRLDPMSAAFLFVNYPLDLQEQDPGEVLPKVTVEQERGGYVFRNRWQDDEDFVTTVFLDSHFPGGGWSSLEAADLRISGLGVDWTVRGMGWGNGSASKRATNLRQYQNVLLVPEVVRAGHEAVATFFEPRPDGSGALSMDLGGVYAPPPRGSDPPAADTPKIAGMRALAVDYSGRSGAPALFAVVDRVSGTAGRNVWQLVTEKAHPVAVEGRTFTIRADGGATLRGTVVAPAAARVATEEVTLVHEINYHGGHKRAPFARTVLGVSGGEFFFIVMTVQPGDPPAVRVEGDGPGAAATVGRQVLRFDGKRIVVQAADPGAGP